MENKKDTLIELKHVKKVFKDGVTIIEDLNLEIKKGEFVTLLGPSGCGKTTILRMIGGFEKISAGELLLNGKDISNLPPNERPINTVFQKYALFPHLNVYDNIAFGLKIKGLDKKAQDEKVKRFLRWWISRALRREASARFPVVSSRELPLHVPLSTSRRCCFWMSP